MNKLIETLTQLQNNEIDVDAAAKAISAMTFTDLGFAKVDHHRKVRNGAGEVIFGENKTPEEIVGIIGTMVEHGQENILITRLPETTYVEVCEMLGTPPSPGTPPPACGHLPLGGRTSYDPRSRIAVFGENNEPGGHGYILVATAGTSDIPVAEEAARTAEFLGNRVERLYDAGVAGIHRLLSKEDLIKSASVIIAIAGMEGALASVIGGLASAPVIAVPTSVGYGASFGGLCALLAMMNSCASGVSVVNIDNGFGAGYMADMINHVGNLQIND